MMYKTSAADTRHDRAAREFDAFSPGEPEAARDFYDAEGYVVLRGLLSHAQCDRVMAQFDRQVRHSRLPILRQKNMRYEANAFTADGFLANPIFNVQDLQTRPFGGFKHAVLDVLTDQGVASATAFLLRGPKTKVIQSMFFEAPAGTWAHQDSYYQDSASALGQAVAGWFALEDIGEAAGRFFVCPRSHRSMAVVRNDGKVNFAAGHETYKQTIAEMMQSNSLPVVAPALAKGDVLFWNSLTVHGSFAADDGTLGGGGGVSRRSLTAHYLRDDDEMLQFHSRVRRQDMTEWNAMRVGLLHDQDKRKNRMIRDAAYRFPGPYMTARKWALKLLLATRGGRKAPAAEPS